MKALIIDTSLEISYIILVKDNEIIFLKKIEKQNLTKNIFLIVQNILKETKTDLSNLSYIAASLGPGLFTSLRVGANICKTLCYAKKIPLIGYISMHTFLPNFDTKFSIALDAKSEGLYLIEGETNSGKIKYFSKPYLISFEEAKKIFKKTKIIISPHTKILKEKFDNFKEKFKQKELDPHRLIDITNGHYRDKKFENFSSFNLLYLRGPKHS